MNATIITTTLHPSEIPKPIRSYKIEKTITAIKQMTI